ncbi:MAG TPA: N-acetylglucosamine-6-phosphate deacetylase [Candidatus Udaeobacter sp.]|nr:MAG: N-acetylglucosamine-6-phosphate deacetylase [Verrucomicrobiota bacterium]PYL32614.1 MAG: N-acetylglucosamine-6-phosphate deacetylase [Verrucomicrobiota bacterium]HMC25296.1 N-acetylglucosamine-6-phosphate deacetylase [Candidatus Udaeobacter sp.]
MILTNARLIFRDGIREGLELVVEKGRISAIRERSHARANEIIDLHENYLAPGFIDLHVHGALGRDSMEASAEAFQVICDYHATGGTTSLLLTTATAPLDRIADVLNVVRDCIPRLALATASGLWPSPTISQIAGVHIEGPFISKAKCGAQQPEFIQNPSRASVQQLLDHANVIKRITMAPELQGALEAIENFYTHGISVSGGHSDAWDEEAEKGFARGMRSVTHTFNCMSSARRRGIYRVGGLLEFALSEPRIGCELIADGQHVSGTLMKMLYHAKGPGGICLVTDASAGAGLPNGSHFSLFGQDCIVEDGVCLLADRSALAGSASRMIDLVRTMIMKVNVPLHEAVMMATGNPARAIGLETKGRLEIGADADLVLLSPELEVLRTLAGGEEIWSQ